MESNLATVAIKIRNNTELQQAAKAVEALLTENTVGEAVMPALNLMGEAFIKQLAIAKNKAGEWAGVGSGKDSEGDVEEGGGGGGWLAGWGWGGGGSGGAAVGNNEEEGGGPKGVTLFAEQVKDESVATTGNKNMAQTRAEIRTANQKMKSVRSVQKELNRGSSKFLEAEGGGMLGGPGGGGATV